MRKRDAAMNRTPKRESIARPGQPRGSGRGIVTMMSALKYSLMRAAAYVALAVILGGVLTVVSGPADAQSASLNDAYRDTAARLTQAATADTFAWQRLAELSD